MNDECVRTNVDPAIDGEFCRFVLPHLDAAYRLARWLTRNEHDAEDVVPEASLRALRYFRTFTGGNGRPGSCGSCGTRAMAGGRPAARQPPTRSMKSATP